MVVNGNGPSLIGRVWLEQMKLDCVSADEVDSQDGCIAYGDVSVVATL